MKILTLNFLTCARKSCKLEPASFPLHPRDAELEVVELELQPEFIANLLPRLEWEALRGVCCELGLPTLPDTSPDPADLFTNSTSDTSITSTAAAVAAAAEDAPPQTKSKEPSQTLRDLHSILLETTMASGKLVCGHCGHQYAVKEGIANFLLPPHMV